MNNFSFRALVHRTFPMLIIIAEVLHSISISFFFLSYPINKNCSGNVIGITAAEKRVSKYKNTQQNKGNDENSYRINLPFFFFLFSFVFCSPHIRRIIYFLFMVFILFFFFQIYNPIVHSVIVQEKNRNKLCRYGYYNTP